MQKLRTTKRGRKSLPGRILRASDAYKKYQNSPELLAHRQAKASHLRKRRRAEREALGHDAVAKSLSAHARAQKLQGNKVGARQAQAIANRRRKQAKQIRKRAKRR